jgi:hypothetical protein
MAETSAPRAVQPAGALDPNPVEIRAMQNIHETHENDYGGRDSDRYYEDEELDAMMLADQAEREADADARQAETAMSSEPAEPSTAARIAAGNVSIIGAVTDLFTRKAS